VREDREIGEGWWMLRGRERGGKTYSDLKIHSFIRYRTHAVVEAERILAHVVRREDEVALALFWPSIIVWSPGPITR